MAVTDMVSVAAGAAGDGAGRTMATVTVMAGRITATTVTMVTMGRCPTTTKVFRIGVRPGLSCTATVAGSTIFWDRTSSRCRPPVSVITAARARG
jgi:hypothetical protein